MVERSRRIAPFLSAVVLALAGVLMVAGGVLHPHVPARSAAQMEVIAGNERWVQSHWTLTLAQPLAIAGVFLLAERLSRARPSPALRGGALLAGAGFLVGTLGTLSAATALPAAAEAGDPSLFAAVNAWTLGLGWLCIAIAAAGGLLLGGRIATLAGGLGGRSIGGLAAGLSFLLLVAMTVFEPSHPWTHDRILRASSIVVGLLLLALGLWLAQRSVGRPSSNPARPEA